MSDYRKYRRTAIAELAYWHPDFDMTDVSVSVADEQAGSPKEGDMIARNPANHADRWLIAADYFAANFEPLAASPGGTEGWRPIETAPKDGTPVLAWQQSYYRGKGAVCVALWQAGSWWEMTPARIEPTHWMPLPAAPTEDRPVEPASTGEEDQPTEDDGQDFASSISQALPERHPDCREDGPCRWPECVPCVGATERDETMDEIERLVHAFSDAAVHFAQGSRDNLALWPRYCRSKAALLDAIRARIRAPTESRSTE